MALQEKDVQLFNLEGESELQFVVRNASSNVTLELTAGSAEIFGAELILNKSYIFSSFAAVGVFTWNGCTVKLTGEVNETCVVKIIPESYELHERLEKLRNKAENENCKGPITLIVGPTDVGKSTLCRSLLNYAAQHGRKPLFIDLDVGQSSLSISGTVGILPITKPVDILEGFDERELSVHYFGYKSPGHNILLYFLLIKKLGRNVGIRMNYASKDMQVSGVIIDTCGWVLDKGYESIICAVKSFSVNVLLVVGEEDLYDQLMDDVSSHVKIIFIPKLRGVVKRNKTVRFQKRESSVHEYFYGSVKPLVPYSFEIKFSDIQIIKIVPSKNHSANIHNVTENSFDLVSVDIGPVLLNQVLALSYADRVEDIILTSVLGFVCIVEISINHNTITVLSPQPKPLPKKLLLLGDILLTLQNS